MTNRNFKGHFLPNRKVAKELWGVNDGHLWF